jgi:hypothetical protein
MNAGELHEQEPNRMLQDCIDEEHCDEGDSLTMKRQTKLDQMKTLPTMILLLEYHS